MKKWTSKVDLFSKKYVVIPINEAYAPQTPKIPSTLVGFLLLVY